MKISGHEAVYGHYRGFIVPEQLVQDLETNGWSVDQMTVGYGLAALGAEDPRIIRIEASR